MSEVIVVRRHVPPRQQGTFQEQNALYKTDHLLPLLKIVPTETGLYCEACVEELILKNQLLGLC